jgi:hypothetical protein
LLCDQPDVGSEMKTPGCNNLLAGQRNRTRHGVMIDECVALPEWWLAKENWRNCKKPLLQFHFTMYLICSHQGFNWLLREKKVHNCLSYIRTFGIRRPNSRLNSGTLNIMTDYVIYYTKGLMNELVCLLADYLPKWLIDWHHKCPLVGFTRN